MSAMEAAIKTLEVKRDELDRALQVLRAHSGEAVAPKRERERPQRSGDKEALAQWRDELVSKILKHPRGSVFRRRAVAKAVAAEHQLPDGSMRKLSTSTVYLWLRKAEGK